MTMKRILCKCFGHPWRGLNAAEITIYYQRWQQLGGSPVFAICKRCGEAR